jgi:hypothetical protein
MSLTSSAVDRLLAPRYGPGVCPRCLNLTREPSGLCRACHSGNSRLSVVVPISYSVGGEWLHHVIASYKRDADPSVPDAVFTLAEICDRFLSAHEVCVSAAAGVDGFELVTTVPSGQPDRDVHHPLRRIIGEMVHATHGRHERLLVCGPVPAAPRQFDAARYRATRRLHGEAVLLVDDMWTSGASAQSAAAALLAAGAGSVAAVVIARHLNRSWHQNDARLGGLGTHTFDFRHCALCAADRSP